MPPTIKRATPDDATALRFVNALADANGHAVGFLPWIAYEQALQQRRITIVYENGWPAGYLIRGPLLETTKVYQICICDDLRRIEHGTALIDQLRDDAAAAKAHQISLHCATDLEANQFWQTLNFQHVGKRLKDRTGKRWQNRYVQELPEKALSALRAKARLNDRSIEPLARLLLKGKLDVAAMLEKNHNRRQRSRRH